MADILAPISTEVDGNRVACLPSGAGLPAAELQSCSSEIVGTVTQLWLAASQDRTGCWNASYRRHH